MVRVGAVDVPLAEVPALFERFQTENAELQRYAEIGQVLDTFTERFGVDATGVLLNQVEESIAKGGKAESKPLFEIELPGTFKPVRWNKVETDDMSDRELTMLVQMQGLGTEFAARLQSLSNIVTGMQSHIQGLHSETMDSKTATALRLHGINTDAAGVRRMREEFGIAEPLKAIPFIKAQFGIQAGTPAAPVQPAAPGDAPPEAPISGGTNVFNDDLGMDADEVFRRRLKGEIPASSLKTA